MKALTWSSVNCRMELEAENLVGLFATSLQISVFSQAEQVMHRLLRSQTAGNSLFQCTEVAGCNQGFPAPAAEAVYSPGASRSCGSSTVFARGAQDLPSLGALSLYSVKQMSWSVLQEGWPQSLL